MKKFVVMGIALVVALALSLTISAFAEGYYVHTVKDPLIVRDAPQGGFPIGQVKKGSRVEVVEKTTNWMYKITYNGGYGWVAAEYLVPEGTQALIEEKRSKSPTTENVQTKVAPARERYTSDPGVGGDTYEVNENMTGWLNVRKWPSRKEGRIAKLFAGDRIQVVDIVDDTWAKVYINGGYGYVMHKFLREAE